MCKKAVDTCPFMLDCVRNSYKPREKKKENVSREPFICADKFKSQKICGKAFDACLSLLKFIPD